MSIRYLQLVDELKTILNRELDEIYPKGPLAELHRRVMPAIIANDIVGVSPLAPPGPEVYALRQRYKEEDQK